MTYDYAILGGGIVGLSTAMALSRRYPDARIVLVEKETSLASHQTANNSGVIHSGIYYKPGSLKARFAIEGARVIPEFCQEHGLDYDVCGKVIVATDESELPRLDKLLSRGFGHGLPVSKLSGDEVKEREPHCRAVGGILVETTGICDYLAISLKYGELFEQAGGEIRLGTRVLGTQKQTDSIVIQTSGDDIEARFLVNCCGLHSDRVARLDGQNPPAQIVPFRGEYFELVPHKRHLCKHLIYPVPNPDFPFLGVHFTRMIDGNIHCGPNAVLALKREGYEKSDFSMRDFLETMKFGGFWKLASKHFAEGWNEFYRSMSKAAFARSLQKMIPEVQEDDLVPSHAGVRAQAMTPEGNLVDDFMIVRGTRSVHVLNAPSPAATASIPIGRAISEEVPAPTRRRVAV